MEIYFKIALSAVFVLCVILALLGIALLFVETLPMIVRAILSTICVCVGIAFGAITFGLIVTD